MNKREFPRYDKDLMIEYHAGAHHQEALSPGRVLNISLGGIYMLSGSLLDKGSVIFLTFHVQKDDKIVTLTTAGVVLRSGMIVEDSEMLSRYNLQSSECVYYAVVKFDSPFAELSFMLH